MPALKRNLFHIVRWFVATFKLPRRFRDLLMWPITTRLLGRDYKGVVDRGEYRIFVDLEDQLNRLLLFYGNKYLRIWEPQTIKLLKILISGRKTVLTAGSHIGFVNLELLKSLHPAGIIHTFEPASHLFERTKENISLNGLGERICVHNTALGDSAGEAELFVSNLRTSLIAYTPDHLNKTKKEVVRVVALDEWVDENLKESIDLLVLDVEGYELPVLKGGVNILERDRPLICFEVAIKIDGGAEANKLYAFLQDRGYELYAIEDDYALENIQDGQDRPVNLKIIADHQVRGGYFNVIACHTSSNLISAVRSMVGKS